MNKDLKEYLTGFWYAVLLLVVGGIFNTAIALLSAVFPIVVAIIPFLVGYALYTIYKELKGKNEQV